MIEKGEIMCDQFHKCMKKPKILLVPYPAQGHVTPMIKLGSALHSYGFHPILITPDFIHRRIKTSFDQNDGISCVSIPDGSEEDEEQQQQAMDFFSIEKAMENTMPLHLERLFREANQLGGDGGVVFIVVDLLASWAFEVAERCGVPAVGFWAVMFATYRLIDGIPDMVNTGFISDTGSPRYNKDTLCTLPNQPRNLSTEHLPWLIGNSTSRTSRFHFWTRTLNRSKSLKWILINSFYPEELTPTNINNQTQQIYPIGPLNNNHPSNSVKTPTFWEEDITCIHWLNQQKPNSVIYISFGSWVSPIDESKLRNLALSLQQLDKPFIWVLGSNWVHGLPNGYLSGLQDKGKIVSWAPQMEVLKHESVGFYLTHCGWNSIIEAVGFGKPMLCYPIAGDQFVNCDYVVQVWKIGVRIYGFGLKEIEFGLRKVVEDFGIKKRFEELNEKFNGVESRCKVRDHFIAFFDDFKKQTLT